MRTQPWWSLLALVVALLSACTSTSQRLADDPRPVPPSVSTPSVSTPSAPMNSASTPSTTAPPSSPATPATPTSSAASPAHHSDRPAVVTREGLWWGVDSTEPISRHTLANVADWYRGARPQLWGRYLRGDYGVTSDELAFARAHSIYVYVIVGDRNCSGCGGGDACDNDRTAAQARSDADDAVDRARELRLPAGTTLFKDIEQVSSCRGEPTREYLLAWYHTVRPTGYRIGFYGNVHKQHYDFPVAYCKASALDRAFAADVLLDMNQPEPRLGAPRGSTSPGNAPKFRPNSPSCADKAKTVIWQYGESIDRDNLTDIDQARPDTPGLLAPDGSVT